MTQLNGIRKSSHLTDAQFLVLSEAAGRDSGFIVIPERLKGKAAQSFVRTLIGKELVREVPVQDGHAGLAPQRGDRENLCLGDHSGWA